MRRIGIMLLLLILLLTGCGGVSKEDYDAAVRERDALQEELQETQAKLQELRDSTDTMTGTLKGSFTATVRALLDYDVPEMAVVSLFQSTPFFLCTEKLTEQLEVGETYVFEIETRENLEIPASEYASGCPDPVDIPWHNLWAASARLAGEADGGLDSCHLVYET